jgi:uncharacterized protein YjbJ (UPF0337 family)
LQGTNLATRRRQTGRFRGSSRGNPTGSATEPGGPGLGLDDKAKDKAQELKGEAKEGLGRATDDEELQAEGQADQAKGNLKQAGEKVKDAFK